MSDGNGHRGTDGDRQGRTTDPLHRIPLIGRIVRESDALRNRIPVVGSHLTRADADLLRLEARLLRLAAAQLEARAAQLDRLRTGEKTTGVRRIQVE